MHKDLKIINKGLTLIELVIVITIIALLLILSFVIYKAQIAKAHDAKRKSDIYYIKEALEEYEKDKECYPPALPICNPGDGLKPYLEKIPCDPVTKMTYFYYADPSSSCPKWYWIFSHLDFTKDPKIGELGCEIGCGPNLAFNFYQTSPNAPEPIKGDIEASEPPEASPPQPPSGLYGCFSGVCLPIDWNPARGENGGPECDPNYSSSNCGGSACGGTTCCQDASGNNINECSTVY